MKMIAQTGTSAVVAVAAAPTTAVIQRVVTSAHVTWATPSPLTRDPVRMSTSASLATPAVIRCLILGQ